MSDTTKIDEKLKRLIYQEREKLFNRIAQRFRIPTQIKLEKAEKIIDGAEGCFEGDIIKIRKTLPLFQQLLVLEHEIGHYLAQKQNITPRRKTFRVYRKKEDDSYEKEEIKAWKWVEDHPIAKNGIIDQEMQRYLKKLSSITKNEESIYSCLLWAFWF